MSWFYAIDNQQKGPISREELEGLLRTNAISEQAFVWQEGMPEGVPANQIFTSIVPDPVVTASSLVDTPSAIASPGAAVATTSGTSSNPYKARAAEVIESDQQLFSYARDLTGQLESAPKWNRFLGYLIDYSVGIFGSALVFGIVVALLFGEAGIAKLEGIPDFLFGVVFILLYYIPQEVIFGRTIGKLIMGTRVVNENGLKASFGQIVGRSFCRIIPFEAFSFLGETGRGWHDTIPKTFVVKCR